MLIPNHNNNNKDRQTETKSAKMKVTSNLGFLIEWPVERFVSIPKIVHCVYFLWKCFPYSKCFDFWKTGNLLTNDEMVSD